MQSLTEDPKLTPGTCAIKVYYAVILLLGLFNAASAMAEFVVFAAFDFEHTTQFNIIVAETVFRFWLGATLMYVYRGRDIEFAEQYPELSKWLAGFYGMILCVYTVLLSIIFNQFVIQRIKDSNHTYEILSSSQEANMIIQIGLFYVCGLVVLTCLAITLLVLSIIMVSIICCIKAIWACRGPSDYDDCCV